MTWFIIFMMALMPSMMAAAIVGLVSGEYGIIAGTGTFCFILGLLMGANK